MKTHPWSQYISTESGCHVILTNRETLRNGRYSRTNHREQSSEEDYLNSYTDINSNISSLVDDKIKLRGCWVFWGSVLCCDTQVCLILFCWMFCLMRFDDFLLILCLMLVQGLAVACVSQTLPCLHFICRWTTLKMLHTCRCSWRQRVKSVRHCQIEFTRVYTSVQAWDPWDNLHL